MALNLLLDIDGVLVRDKKLFEHLNENIVSYVQHKVPSCKNPVGLNKTLYKGYGHTAVGLEKALKIDASDFDRRVYDKNLMNHLWGVLSSPEFHQEAEIVHEIAKSGWDVTLFSNSPLLWSTPVSQAISSEIKNFKDYTFMKPDVRAYTYGFSINKPYIFIDDTVANLRTAGTLPNWQPIQFSPELNKEFITIGSVWEMGIMCNTIRHKGLGSLVNKMDNRVSEYKKKLNELNMYGGHMMDYIGLEKMYPDVIAFLREKNTK
jgi:hypothetical protein